MAELRFEVSGDAFVVSEVSEFAAARLGAKLLGHRPCGGEVSGEWDRGSLTPITTAGFEGKASDWTEYVVWAIGVIGVFAYMMNPNMRRNLHAAEDDEPTVLRPDSDAQPAGRRKAD